MTAKLEFSFCSKKIPLTPSYGLFFVKVEIHFEMWYFFRTETKFKFGCHISNIVTNVILKIVKE